MASIKKIIFIQAGGNEYLEIPLAQKTLLKPPYSAFYLTLRPLLNLIYQGGLSKNDLKDLDFYLPGDDSWVIFDLAGEFSPFSLCFTNLKGSVSALFLSGIYEKEVFFEEEKPKNAAEVLKFVKIQNWDHSELLSDPKEIRSQLWEAKPSDHFRWHAHPDHAPLTQILSYLSSPKTLPYSLINKALLSLHIPGGKRSISLKALRDALADFYEMWNDIRLAEEKLPELSAWQKTYVERAELEQVYQELMGKANFRAAELKKEKKTLLNQQKSNKKALSLLQKKINQTEAQYSADYKNNLKELGFWEHSLKIARRKQKEAPDNEADSAVDEALLLKKNRWIQLEQAKYLQLYSEEVEKLESEAKAETQRVNDELVQVLEDFEKLDKKLALLHETKDRMNGPAEESSPGQAGFKQQKQHIEEVLGLVEQLREQEIAAIHIRREREAQIHQANIKPFEDRIKQLNGWLENKSKSFYGWLDNRYPGWQKTIGKVIREDVLFDSSLNPSLVRLNDLLYGIQLSIGDLSHQAPTIEELNLERRELQAEIAHQEEKFAELKEENAKQLQNCEKKYRSRIRQLKNSLQELDIQLEQSELRKRKREAEQQQEFHLQKQEKQKASLQIEYKKKELNKHLEELSHELIRIPQWLKEKKSQRFQGYQDQISSLETLYEENFPGESIPAQASDQEQVWLDKVFYLEKIPHFEQQITRLNEELLELEEKADKEKKSQMRSFQKIEENVIVHTRRLETIDLQLERWEKIREDAAPVDSGEELGFLMDQLEMASSEKADLGERLRTLGYKFSKNFSAQNPFQFPPALNTEGSLDAFHTALTVLTEEGLEQVKQGLVQKFTNLFNLASNQAQSILEVPGLLKKEVDSLNKALTEFSLEKLTLKLSTSPTQFPLFHLLEEIHDFYEKSGNSLGGISLFNPTPDTDANEKALNLLSRLAEALRDHPYGFLELSNAIKIDVPRLGRQLQSWGNTCLISALAIKLKEKNKDLPLYLMVDDLDKYTGKWIRQWLKKMEKHGIGVLAMSQLGKAAEAYEKVLIWQEESWVEAKKN